jgi:uncharacterized protein YjiS (DUF1127 family)
MADIDVSSRPHRGIAHMLCLPFVAFYRAMVRMAENDPRYLELSRLCALSDDELNAIGLRREQLANHVMRGRVLY